MILREYSIKYIKSLHMRQTVFVTRHLTNIRKNLSIHSEALVHLKCT